jgi:2-oxoglutarate dehydrogenase E1 component
MATST